MLRSKELTLLVAVITGISGWVPVATGEQAIFDETIIDKGVLDQAIVDATTPEVAQGEAAYEIETRYGEVYAELESGELKADVYMPKGEGPFPGVVVVHGGAWFMGTRAQLSGVAQLLAQNGMTAVAITYRLAPKHKFPAQIEDCKSAVRWMRERAGELKIDPARLGGFGYSAGAQLVALLGTTDAGDGLEGVGVSEESPTTRLQAVAAGGVPCDFRVLPVDSKRLAFWLGGTRGEVSEQYRLASPRAFVTPDDPPMFFFHGETDDLVPMESPEAMCASLEEAGIWNELYVVPKIGHNFAAMDRKALAKSVDFLSDRLAAKKKLAAKDSP